MTERMYVDTLFGHQAEVTCLDCLRKRPSMSQILEHKFLGGNEKHWKKLDGSVAVPMTRGQTTVVGVLGFIVLIFTCLHILQYVLATDSSDALRKLVGDVPTTTPVTNVFTPFEPPSN